MHAEKEKALHTTLRLRSRTSILLKGYCELEVRGDSHESLERYENIVFFLFLRIDSREKSPDSRCESPGHLSRCR